MKLLVLVALFACLLGAEGIAPKRHPNFKLPNEKQASFALGESVEEFLEDFSGPEDIETSKEDGLEASLDSDVVVNKNAAPSSEKTTIGSEDVKYSSSETSGGGDGENNSGSDDPERPTSVDKSQQSVSASSSSEGSEQQEEFTVDENASDDDKIKSLWLKAMERPPSSTGLKETIKALGKKNIGRKSMYQHLLAQLSNPLNTHAKRIMWLDPEFSLSVKGLAVMAMQPEKSVSSYVVNEDGGITYKSSMLLQTGPRAIRLSAPTGTHFIQVALAKSLAHSVNASVICLDSQTIEQMKSKASDLSVKRKSLSVKNIFSQLFEAVKGIDEPVMVMLQGRPKWLFENGHKGDDLLHTVLEEVNSRASRMFFVMTQPNNPVRTAMESANEAKRAEENSGEFTPPAPGYAPPGAASPGAQPQVDGAYGHGQMTHLVARIIFRNGTAHLGISSGRPLQHPLPPADNNAPENANPYFRMPPPEMMKKILAEQQRLNRGPSFINFNDEARFKEMFPIMVGPVTLPPVPIFSPPPSSSEEEIFEAMRTPENTAIMNGFLDQLMHVIFKNIPLAPEAMPSPDEEPRPIPAGIEIISHQGPSAEKHLEIKFHLLAPSNMLKDVPRSPAPPTINDFLPPDPLSSQPGSPFSSSLPGADVEDSEVNPQNPFRVPLRWGMRDPTNGPAGAQGQRQAGSAERKEGGSERVFGAVSRRVLSLFEEVVVEAPRDQTLRSAWDDMVADEVKGRVAKFNSRQLRKQLHKAGLSTEPKTLERLLDKLGVNILTSEEVTKAINYAVKLQAGGADCVGLQINGEAVSCDPSTLQYWALDLAISSALKITASRFGKPAVQTKEELLAKNLDKYEKALVSNIISPQELGVTYDMIGGLDSAKESLRQAITYPLKYPWLYSEGIAQEAVKGVLLFGPPGTGKTMLAKAVATEGGATFLTIDAGTIENKWLGESEKNAKAVFTLARHIAPCVIYLDEVDSILSSREQGDDSSHGTLTSVKTTLMQEWDGLRTTKDRVVVIASTNRPFDLDEAVLRRLPRRILVDLPDLKTRREIMEVTLANNRLSSEVNLTSIAMQLEGYSGSDIKEVCREAVVRVSHERARMLESGNDASQETGDALTTTEFFAADVATSIDDAMEQEESPLRAVSVGDFKLAMKKLKASVNDNGREMQKVMEWNSKYGEITEKKRSKGAVNMQMYV